MGYTEAISSVVEKHGWQLFFLHPDDVITKVVKEFYAHLTSSGNAFIYVRSASVLFDEYSINVQYGLSEVPDEHPQLVKTVTVEGINQVLQDLGVEGTNLTVSQNDCYIINRVSLKPHCRVRYHFIKSHLSLSTHNSFISKEREQVPRHPGSTSTSSPPTGTHYAPSTSHNDFEQQVLGAFDILKQKFRLMEKQ
ncbi:hypothetical protein PVK06_030881 [Gossypium arboreum]|uniref:Putative plant transposon protein domain-containing protein n=1 Tax=Gossypium arboreum TaxID=29729 RepID=A0ABR0NPH8_GOSAR|nr:hypothetical protein PVK06_030881 [Gossypium arboreum]